MFSNSSKQNFTRCCYIIEELQICNSAKDKGSQSLYLTFKHICVCLYCETEIINILNDFVVDFFNFQITDIF